MGTNWNGQQHYTCRLVYVGTCKHVLVQMSASGADYTTGVLSAYVEIAVWKA